jgi:HAD superfamily hydrolase (TIGR01549 family)
MFDVDGTLVDSTYHHALAWAKAFADVGLDMPIWRLHRAVGMGGDRLVAAVAGDVVEDKVGDELRERHAARFEELFEDVRAFSATPEVLREVRHRGFRVAVASSGTRSNTTRALDLAEIGSLVDLVVTGDDVDASKPDPDVLGVTLRRADTATAVMVGDTVYDVEAAGRLGVDCLTVRSGGFGTDELREAGARDVVDDVGDLLGYDWDGLFASTAKTHA